jgi:hypothetical protein
MTLTLRHFARLKNRRRDSSSSSLSQRPWLQSNSHELNRRTRLYSLLTDSNQRVACQLLDGRPFMRRKIQTWSSSSRFGEDSLRFPWGVSFRECRIYCARFWSSKHTIKEILQRELWLRGFSRRCVPHSFSEAQKAGRTAMTHDPLSIIYLKTDYFFSDYDR